MDLNHEKKMYKTTKWRLGGKEIAAPMTEVHQTSTLCTA